MKKMSQVNLMLMFEAYDIRTRMVMSEIFNQADKLKIKNIGIGMRDKTFKDSEGWPFEADSSIFVDGEYRNWPTAWALVANVDKALSKMHNLFPLEDYHNYWKEFHVICGGAGNHGQHQLSNVKFIVPGIYRKINDIWEKIN